MRLDEQWITTRLQENKLRTELAAGLIVAPYPTILCDQKHLFEHRAGVA